MGDSRSFQSHATNYEGRLKMYKKMLVPLDGSELAECVLPHVESIANGCGVVEVVFLRVVEPIDWVVGPSYLPSGMNGSTGLSEEQIWRINSESRAAAEDYLSQVVNRTKLDGVTVRSEVINGKAAEIIAEYATKNGVDLITIATHGRSGVSRWVWGSVADRVLRSSCVPVLMVRVPGCVPGV
jgi:nucleotide-binding universal stress UspA family protein